MSLNTFGKMTKSYGGFTPIWLEVKGTKQSGGKLKAPTSYAVDFPAGTVIPAGTPVYLAKGGGDLIALPTFVLAAALLAGDTKIVFKKAGAIPTPNAGMFLMIEPATYATTGTAYTVPAGGVIVGDTIEIPIVANAWGTAPIGTKFVAAAATGASKLIATTPNGLLWHDIVIEEGDTSATGGVVDEGRIFENRISPIPACVKAAIPNVIFEKES